MTSKSSGACSPPWTVLTFSSSGTFGSVAFARMPLSSSAVGNAGAAVVSVFSVAVVSAAVVSVVVSPLPSPSPQAARARAAPRAAVIAVILLSFTGKNSPVDRGASALMVHVLKM